MSAPDLRFETEASADGHAVVAGVDEVGRGPLAGPVVAAAVVLAADAPAGLDDSKKLSSARREILSVAILRTCTVAVASVPATTVDALNVRAASLFAMRLAIEGLAVRPDLVLVDSNAEVPDLAIAQRTIVGGDGRSRSIAAASIVAKVARDRMMVRAADLWPPYGFEGHKGYGVATHRAAIADHGPSPLHRMSFAPLRTR